MDKTARIDYTLFAILGERETVIVDCGCTPALARKRGFPGYVNPAEAFKRIDILFPGHDPALLTEFPGVAEDVTRLV